jgi:hypothetical protein
VTVSQIVTAVLLGTGVILFALAGYISHVQKKRQLRLLRQHSEKESPPPKTAPSTWTKTVVVGLGALLAGCLLSGTVLYGLIRAYASTLPQNMEADVGFGAQRMLELYATGGLATALAVGFLFGVWCARRTRDRD